MEVESSSAPDLTLIDLPGIARVAVEGQPHDIEKQVGLQSYFVLANNVLYLWHLTRLQQEHFNRALIA